MQRDPFRNATTKTQKYGVLTVTLHNRMDETILVLPNVNSSPSPPSSLTDDEELVKLLSDLNRPDLDVLGFWVFISDPTTGVEEVHHLILPVQVLAQAVLILPDGVMPTDIQIYESLDYNTKPDKDNNPPPLPPIRFVSQTKIVRARIDQPTEHY